MLRASTLGLRGGARGVARLLVPSLGPLGIRSPITRASSGNLADLRQPVLF
ncbi:MAG: hypothetical protein AAGK98_11115 [Pseudomonadota bacterium]